MLDTNTTMFLVPGLGLDVEVMKITNGFINAYLRDVDYDQEYDTPVFMLYRPGDIGKFQEFALQEYQRTTCLVDDYDYAGGFVVLVYNFPKEYGPEYNFFIKGKYSRFRKRYINKIPKMVIIKTAGGHTEPQLTIPYMACTKSEVLQKYWQQKFADPDDPWIQWETGDELWYKPKMSLETLDINKIVSELEQQKI
jgi:hypothetical protein